MLSLAIDTATPTLVVGLVRHDAAVPVTGRDTDLAVAPPAATRVPAESVEVLAEVVLQECRKHNEELIPRVHEVLAHAGMTMAEIDQVVVGCGPGPFTGLRVGMATAQALAHALGVPCVGVCTLDAIAIATGADLVATDARRREVYWARYAEGHRIIGPEVSAPADVTGAAALISVPAALSEQLAATGTRTEGIPTPAALVQAPAIDVVPLYLRRPDAQIPKNL
ncbi:tRNA (adenosine(37)-N6)-threonylcarbamoyltransferase complex dimerization subunit type 1 TsaB [Corynebacterium sp. 13CS0277]|uniref:tRNA (adenosine(37)-N6)-threonylcarbamoyltransferase complex dimerization subunit type 1 TsaB n=1 Tax=Corynebacterium sp. 13CS0277 TaxID=2071994 RepID=UPI000D044027|nr:tRNA (adenosine(37)-N6)-threonylcarbamoyltransferase complex dimerization subunit type 1 TsaB [Corynebacterium sp. 13CS0277]PRQ11571.1 tRNA (adenosine(37)-N6)-threonylcarbamoyltransferase complex dimerization subunit type 1 TsaB [Corynebacterium sp. 13CS0277]